MRALLASTALLLVVPWSAADAGPGEGLSVFVPVELPFEDGGSAVDGSAKMHLGLWLPDVPPGTRVPVIATIGPYFGEKDTHATQPANRLGGHLIARFVPEGYAVAQVSVFGSGRSTHCMDLMGRAEQLGIDAAVTWLGTQAWSNGNVGLIGRSYDGTTVWEAATFGNPHLKTIVPISGLIGQRELLWRNGSAEARAPTFHNGVYGGYGLDRDAEDAYNLCTDYLVATPAGGSAYVSGHDAPGPLDDYWKERSFLDATLANYSGSVFFVHGLHDTNVDPRMAFPTYQKLQAAGIETRGLFGQWGHMYPDRESEHRSLPSGYGREAYPRSVRADWMDDLSEWFGHYLRGGAPKPALHVEVQDDLGAWRVEPTYPPLDATWREVPMSSMLKRVPGPGIVGQMSVVPPYWDFGPLSATHTTRIAGLPQLHLAVTPTGTGGQVFVELMDARTSRHYGHAIMDLRYAHGGTDARPVVPGQPIVARLEFEPLDLQLPPGALLRLVLTPEGQDYLPAPQHAPLIIDADRSVLRLPVIERSSGFFTP